MATEELNQINNRVIHQPQVGLWSRVKQGEVYTVEGNYKRRTLWQWLRNEPKQLQKYTVISFGRTRKFNG